MSLLSGKDGKVMIGGTKLAQIFNWSLNTNSNVASRGTSSSGGYKVTAPGVKSGSGTIAWALDVTDPITDDFEEGSNVTLLLYIDDTNFYSVPATIESMSIDPVDIDDGNDVTGSSSFVTNGAWTKPTY